MAELAALPYDHTTLLLAGPRAGKTLLLLRWRAASTVPTQYLKLTPEDADVSFFLHRFLADWPEIRTRFEQLRAKLGIESWGGLLGLAIAETRPDFCLLLDDFHLTERMPHAGEWMAFIRHFPATGTLAIASRHHLPMLDRAPLDVWEAERLGWEERPECEDLAELPPELLAKTFALHIVGEAPPSREVLELIRRRIACLAPDGSHRLRPAWQPAVAAALFARERASEVWETVEDDLRAFVRRHFRTHHERRLDEILGRIPSEIRRQRPLLLRLEGDLHFENSRIEEARACYQRSLELTQEPEAIRALEVRLFSVALYFPGDVAIALLHARLSDAELSPALAARFFYWQGVMHGDAGDIPASRHALERVLGLVPAGDREVLHFQSLALNTLTGICGRLELVAEAQTFAERMVKLCVEHRLHRNLLTAFSRRLYRAMNNEAAPPALYLLTEIPNEAFQSPNALSLNLYLGCYAWRALVLKQDALALRRFRLCLSHAMAMTHHLGDASRNARIGVMIAQARCGQLEQARGHFEALQAAPLSGRVASNLYQPWAFILIKAGRLDEAEQLLSRLSGTGHAYVQLYLAWIRFLREDRTAVDDVRALLATAEGAVLWENELEIMEQLGLVESVPRFHMQTFGETTLRRVGEEPPHWPRKKALALMAQLVLHPEGVDSETLIETLYQGSDALDPSTSLHRLAYDLRQVLASIGAADLLEAVRGHYRFRWDRVAYCELHEFDALYRKAQSLEADGLDEAAGIFYQQALMVATGPLFDTLPDEELVAIKRDYAARIAHAHAFAKAHAPYLW